MSLDQTAEILNPSEVDVFFSYSRRDTEVILAIEKRLQSWGVQVWRDTDDIAVASSWTKQIVAAIKGCKVFLLLASESSFKSENVAKEIDLAMSSKKVIMPVYLEQVELPDAVAYQLAGIQHVELFGAAEKKAWRQIRAALKANGVVLGDARDSGTLAPLPTVGEPPKVRARPTSRHLALALVAVVGLGGMTFALWPDDDIVIAQETSILIDVPHFARGTACRFELVSERHGGVLSEKMTTASDETVSLPFEDVGEYSILMKTVGGTLLARLPADEAAKLGPEPPQGKLELTPVGGQLTVNIPADGPMRSEGYVLVIRRFEEGAPRTNLGKIVHKDEGSGAGPEVWGPIVVGIEPQSDDASSTGDGPIVLGKKGKYQVHAYRLNAGGDPSTDKGRYVYPWDGGVTSAALSDKTIELVYREEH